MRPASVSVPVFDERSNSCSPSSTSSRRTAWLTAGCVRCTLAAAREKLRSCATARNILSAARSIRKNHYHGTHGLDRATRRSLDVQNLAVLPVDHNLDPSFPWFAVRPPPNSHSDRSVTTGICGASYNRLLLFVNDYHFDFY